MHVGRCVRYPKSTNLWVNVIVCRVGLGKFLSNHVAETD